MEDFLNESPRITQKHTTYRQESFLITPTYKINFYGLE